MAKALVDRLLEGSTVHLLTTKGTLVLGLDDDGAINIEFIPEGELQGQLWPSGKQPSRKS
jgi:hypothetical protein